MNREGRDEFNMTEKENRGIEGDSDRLGRLAIQALALLGGLAGVLIAAFHLLASQRGWSSQGMDGWGLFSPMGGFAFLLLALAGTSGAALYRRSQKKAGIILLFCGILGFPLGYISWSNQAGFMGWATWIPAGVLFTAAGLLALITPRSLRSRLLGQQEGSLERESIEQALFIGTVLAGIGVMTVIFLFSGFLIYAAEDSLKDDADKDREDLAEAETAASMGRWDRAVELYDEILSRNQSNKQALEKRAYAMEMLSTGDKPDQE
ncbi:MAG TPA: hypothetical protein PLK88_03275 [Methanothrix sp.]|nr:hypothetical protein [Methanothrix sp.]